MCKFILCGKYEVRYFPILLSLKTQTQSYTHQHTHILTQRVEICACQKRRYIYIYRELRANDFPVSVCMNYGKVNVIFLAKFNHLRIESDPTSFSILPHDEGWGRNEKKRKRRERNGILEKCDVCFTCKNYENEDIHSTQPITNIHTNEYTL